MILLDDNGVPVGVRPIRIEIPGDPHGLQRHRTRVAGKRAIQYDTKANKQAKARARTYLRGAIYAAGYEERMPFPSGPVRLEVVARFACPKSDYRKRQPRGTRPHVKTPDVDNVLKWVMDSGTGIAWRDDRQVTEAVAVKWIAAQGDEPGTTVTISQATQPTGEQT